MIQVHIQLTGDSAGEISNDLRSLLNGMTAYKGVPINDAGDSGYDMPTNSPPKQTAAQKKAAEKAAKEAAEAAKQAISTGEERVDPEADKADAADEAADTAKEKAAEPAKLTHDDVKNMLSGYVQAYGLDMAQADGAAFIKFPALSKIPDNQKDLAAAILGVADGLNSNPNKRELIGDGITAEKLAVMKEIVNRAKAVK